MTLKLVSLFCGCGGLDLGFHDAGFETVFACDSNVHAARVYERNLPCAVDLRDIRTIPASEVPTADVLAAGFPCQPFSAAGKRRGTGDPAGLLFREAIRIAAHVRPGAILFENVPGILNASCDEDAGGTVAEAVLRGLEGLGCRAGMSVLDAVDYGVPQSRRRVFFLGVRPAMSSGLGARRRVAFQGGIGIHRLSGIEGFPPPRSGAPRTLGDVLPVPAWATDADCGPLGGQDLEVARLVPPGGSWKDVPTELLPERLRRMRGTRYRTCGFYRRKSTDEPCGTLTASFRPSTCSCVHPTEDRLFSVREAARIQSFPDWFRFPGYPTAMYRAIGNAVPPRLAEALASWIRDAWL